MKFGLPMGRRHHRQQFHPAGGQALTKGGGTAGGQSFDDPTVLPPDEAGSALYLTPADENMVPVFNFALARVRYFGLIGAPTVRVFFRLFSAQQTTGIYDYPPGEQYRRGAPTFRRASRSRWPASSRTSMSRFRALRCPASTRRP